MFALKILYYTKNADAATARSSHVCFLVRSAKIGSIVDKTRQKENTMATSTGCCCCWVVTHFIGHFCISNKNRRHLKNFIHFNITLHFVGVSLACLLLHWLAQNCDGLNFRRILHDIMILAIFMLLVRFRLQKSYENSIFSCLVGLGTALDGFASHSLAAKRLFALSSGGVLLACGQEFRVALLLE